MSDKTGIDAIEELTGNIRGYIPGATFQYAVENSFRFSGPKGYRDAYEYMHYSLNGIVDWLDLAVLDAKAERDRLKARIADLENRSMSEQEIEAMGYLKLPVGADGKPIRPGETVYGQDGRAWTVRAITANGTYPVSGSDDRAIRNLKPEWLTHEPPQRYPLDADGVECRPGDTVWLDGSADARCRIVSASWLDSTVSVRGEQPCPPGLIPTVALRSDRFTHTEPDSWERLEEDAVKEFTSDYWGCKDVPCEECPFKIDGETPRDHYGFDTCGQAIKRDILRRAKALAGVEGGDEG